MRPSHRRAIPISTREARIRRAGVSGARALSRLLVALIEHLGQHDRVGARDGAAWPHGSMRSAFGPTPLGAELDRLASVAPRSEPAIGEYLANLPPLADGEDGEAVWPAAFDAFPSTDRAASVKATPPPEAPSIARAAPAGSAKRAVARAAQPAEPRVADPLAATANVPAWQQPFIAAPGVRYMRTPDHLLRRVRDAPIAPIAATDIPRDAAHPGHTFPDETSAEEAFSEIPFAEAPLAKASLADVSRPETSFTAADAPADPDPETAFSDEDALLNTEDQVAVDMDRASAPRFRLLKGYAVDLPLPANDRVWQAPERQPHGDDGAQGGARKQAFAVAVRAKAKAQSAAASASEVSAAAVSARVSLPEMPARSSSPPRRMSVDYEFPPVELLGEPRKPDGVALTADMLEQNARLLETTLEDFGIRGEIIHVRAGPVVTLYELEPAPGMKSSRVIGLADDIARSMSALSARVAVVPGRNAIGIELPNERRETVFFREMVETAEFGDSKHKLAIALGKTIGGEPVVAELAKMPHLLVAGTTGSGKSVAINTMILSLLYRLKPEECRLIMVDPKMLELSVYDGIPHLLTPVVTDPKKAVVALKWAVREMEDRYRKMAKVGVRNIDGFNARVLQAKAGGEVITLSVTTGFDRDTGKPTTEEVALDLTPLPYIVVIVDEMADLMMVAGKDIEGAIQRLAQMARAAGIHLIMATQRPSVDVITGTIKANFPTRISFQVTSKIDSRTILGEQGAEQLLGQGDMLHMQGGGRIYRVHGPFVSDEEVERVVAHLKTQGQPDYLDSVTDDPEGDAEEAGDEDAADAVFDKTAMGTADDESSLYEQAVKVVLRDKKSSVSYVQRRLQVGYNKAASLIERMEKEGILGPASHTGKREILAHSRGRVISGVAAGDGED